MHITPAGLFQGTTSGLGTPIRAVAVSCPPPSPRMYNI